jgi:hypothetical protein
MDVMCEADVETEAEELMNKLDAELRSPSMNNQLER